MKKLLLFINVKHAKHCFVLICFLLLLGGGTVSAKSTETDNKTYFPTCTLTVTASISGSGSSASICQGTSVTLTATASGGTTPYTYSWLPTMGLSNAAIANPVASPTATTTYTVEVRDHAGCSSTASVNIIVNDPPTVNQDTLLLQYLTHEPLSASGGTPPYTYTFSPAISTSSLVALLTSTVTTVYTITVTGANGCSSTYNADYVPLPSESAGACTTIFMSEYIQDTIHNDDAVEIYNPTSAAINIGNYYLMGTTNGSLSATPFFIRLHGSIAAHSTYLIAYTHADTALTHKANMLSDSLTFLGSDIVALAKMVVSSPTLTVSFIDMVGAISPLPTDSGWAVGSGSTKNHTLVRQSSVNQGDLNWSSCKTEWSVYARGTFRYIGHYSNICTPTDPDLNLTITNVQTKCDDPSYVTFDIIASSNPSTILNNCVIDISYFGGEFAGDSVGNGGVIVTRGPDFQPDAGNDYDIFDSADVSPGIAKFTIGDISDSSPNGTYLPILPIYGDTLFSVSLRVQNSCQTGYIKFTNLFNTDTAYYAVIDSQQVTVPDSAYEQICSNCAQPCDSCDYDTGCGCYLSYCCSDSFAWVITGDSTYYAYFSHGNSHYTTIIYAADSFSSATICPFTIFSYNNSINAGTNAESVPPIPAIHDNSSILYIKGMGFGSQKDSIRVSNANNTGMVRLDSVDILLWTENLIKVKMPSYIFNNPDATPGTGPFTIYNACRDSVTDRIQINYNIENVYFPSNTIKARPNIVMQSSMNSIIFRCDTSITHNAAAYACVKKAVREWNCWTGVNWKVGDSIMLDTSENDGISVIYFSNYNFTPTGALMQTQQQALPDCPTSVSDSVAFYDEADIEIRRNLFLSKPWNYDTTYSVTSPLFSYFYDDILHELGHAHGLGHINDLHSLMNWYEPTGQRDSIPSQGAYWPGPGTLLGGWDMVNTSIAHSPSALGCSLYNILLPDTKECNDATASVPIVSKNSYNINLFPNPINYGDLTVTYDLTGNSTVQFRILDCTGRVVINLTNENRSAGNYSEQININNLAGGVYLFTATINGELQTIKFIKL